MSECMFMWRKKHSTTMRIVFGLIGSVACGSLAYAADVTAPTITSIVRQSPTTASITTSDVTFRVTFSEAVQNVDATDFALSGTAAVNASVTSVTALTQSVYDVGVNVPGEGALALVVRTAVDNIQDLAGNAYDDVILLTESYAVDHKPVIDTIVRKLPTDDTVQAGSLVFRVVFSEDVQNVDKTDFSLSGTAASGANISSVASIDAKTYDVTVSATTEGVLALAVASGTDITDGTHTYDGTITAHEDYTVIIGPTVSSIVRHSPSTATVDAGEVTFRVTFSEAVTGVDKSDFELSGTAALKSTIVSVTAISQTVYDIRVSVVDGTVSIAPKSDASIKDGDDHTYVASSSVTAETYTIGYAPLITITAGEKIDTRPVTDTKVVVTDDTAIAVENVTVDATSIVTVTDFSCAQTSGTKVTCTMTIDGSGDLVIRAVDGHANVATVQESGYVISRVVDVAKPKVKKSQKKIKLSKKRTTYLTKKSVTFNGVQEALKGGVVKIYDNKKKLGEAKINASDGKWSKSISFSNGKSYRLKFKFYDKHGDKIASKGAYKLFVDSEKPRFTDLPKTLTKRPGQKIWWEVEDNDRVKKYRYFWFGKKTKTTKPYFVVPSGTPRGTYNLEIRAYDRAGNKTDKTITVRVI